MLHCIAGGTVALKPVKYIGAKALMRLYTRVLSGIWNFNTRVPQMVMAAL